MYTVGNLCGRAANTCTSDCGELLQARLAIMPFYELTDAALPSKLVLTCKERQEGD